MISWILLHSLVAMVLGLIFLRVTYGVNARVRKLRILRNRNTFEQELRGVGLGESKALVVIPCYNEEESISAVVKEILQVQKETPGVFEFIVVDDGSTDDSAALVKALAPGHLIRHPKNLGVAAVLSTAMGILQHYPYDFLVQFDGDGQHPAEKISTLISCARKENLDLLIGSRYIENPNQPTLRGRGSQFLSYCLRLFLKNRLTDPTSGFRVYSTQAIEVLLNELPKDYPEPESVAILALKQLRIGETSVKMRDRKSGVSSLSGWQGPVYMFKVTSALLRLRLQSLFTYKKPFIKSGKRSAIHRTTVENPETLSRFL